MIVLRSGASMTSGLRCDGLQTSALNFKAASWLNDGNQDLTRHVLARRPVCKPGLAAWNGAWAELSDKP